MNQQAHFDLPDIDPRFNPNTTLDNPDFDDEGDKRLLVSFRKVAVMNPLNSTNAGRPIYDEVDYVTIRIPGNQLSVIDAPVTDNGYKTRFADRYNKWKTTQSNAVSGTPLESFPYLMPKVALMAELKAMNVQTVEQLAGLSDGHIQSIMGGIELRKRAAEWLDQTTGTDAKVAKLAKDNDDLQQQLAAMQLQISQISAAKEANKATAK